MKSVLTKKFFLILGLFLSINLSFAQEYEYPEFKTLKVSEGTLLKVVNQREISSALLDAGDTVTFINPQPLYLEDYVLIPKSAIFYGYIEEILEPVEGVNASIKIKLQKVIFPDLNEYPLSAKILYKGKNYVGGELAPVRLYKTTPHFIEKIGGGYLQYTPTSYRYLGSHTIIKPGEELFFVLDKEFSCYPDIEQTIFDSP